MYSLLADIILIVHTLFILFVVLGFVLIVIGLVRDWRWVLNFWFRLAHILAIGVVTVQTVCGNYCPLTLWETQLRQAAGERFYSTSFVQYWIQRLIYYDVPLWIFSIVYGVFTLLVLFAWMVRPPKLSRIGAPKADRR